MKRILLITLTVVLAGCSLGAQSTFSRNLERWQASGVTHYRFSLFVGCFCAFSQRMPLTVEVNGNRVVSMTYADGISISPGEQDFEYFSRFATIDRIFTELQSVLAGEADEVSVTYNAEFGFPEQINIDYIKQALDDELSLSVSNFEIMQ
jgi:hypothetical protein